MRDTTGCYRLTYCTGSTAMDDVDLLALLGFFGRFPLLLNDTLLKLLFMATLGLIYCTCYNPMEVDSVVTCSAWYRPPAPLLLDIVASCMLLVGEIARGNAPESLLSGATF